jgi:L-alanine-DL-glutamate epimerase-like enolase superfamily enzyme
MVQPELWAWGRRDSYTVGLVRLYTDAEITGIGEVNVCTGPDDGVIRAVFDRLGVAFVGDTTLAPGRLLARVLGAGWYPFHRTAALVLGGLEMACWDAVGKYLRQPVSTFFGGALKTSFPSMYYVRAQADLEDGDPHRAADLLSEAAGNDRARTRLRLPPARSGGAGGHHRRANGALSEPLWRSLWHSRKWLE